MKTALLIAVTTLSACGYYPIEEDSALVPESWREVPNRPDTADVVAKLQGIYGFPADTPPTVYTYGGAGLDCPDNSTAWYAADVGKCIDGHYRGGVVLVSDGRGDDRLRRGALAHEVYHYYLRAMTGNRDPGHTNSGWRPGAAVNAADDAVDGAYREPR